MGDLEAQQAELEILESIFSDLISFESGNKVRFTFSDNVKLSIVLPETYPSQELPQYELSGPSLSRNERHQLISSLNNVMLENVGSPIIYTLVTMVKNFLEVCCFSSLSSVQLAITDNEDKNDSHLNIVVPTIQHGDVLTDRKSRFQAHVARVHSEDEVKLVLERLLENPKIVRATHNIYAYRIIQSKDGRITRLQNCFDDGETGASSKVLQLLEKMKAENVLVVVSRWYGGIHLGPDRFRHITNLTYDILS
ncbi:hypothetical protein Angca_004253, partial [Angiostrongylus cantonensis]